MQTSALGLSVIQPSNVGINMLTHAQIENLIFYSDSETRNVIAAAKSNSTDLSSQFIAFGPRVAPEPCLETLLVAAPVLYQQLTLQHRALQGLIDIIERLPKPTKDGAKLVKAFTELQNGCLLAQRVAQVGIDEVYNTLPERPL